MKNRIYRYDRDLRRRIFTLPATDYYSDIVRANGRMIAVGGESLAFVSDSGEVTTKPIDIGYPVLVSHGHLWGGNAARLNRLNSDLTVSNFPLPYQDWHGGGSGHGWVVQDKRPVYVLYERRDRLVGFIAGAMESTYDGDSLTAVGIGHVTATGEAVEGPLQDDRCIQADWTVPMNNNLIVVDRAGHLWSATCAGLDVDRGIF